jgi:transcriptional regulator with XRE-family HTH domain
MAFAAKLKELRVKNRQSLQQVADGVGTSKTHIWDMEQGNSENPSRALLQKIAEHFRVSVSELVGEDPNASGEPSELVALYRDLKKLSPDDIRTIEAVMKSLKERPR